MLVKLGSVWVDPESVIFISSSSTGVSVSVREDGFVGAVPIASADSLEQADAMRDEFAAVVNDALQSQSFGGEIEKETQATS